MRVAGLCCLLLATPALAGEAKVDLVVDGTMVVGDDVRVGGTAARGATVSLFSGAGCKGDALARAEVDAGGRFTVAAHGNFEPPFTISLRAAVEDRRSDCFEVTVPAPKGWTPPDARK